MIGGVWNVPITNFDNILYALITVFILSTQANWNVIMYYAIDGDTSDKVLFLFRRRLYIIKIFRDQA